ncbi:1,4-alpha-glucan branching enzyme [Kytococcus aerolatus]|uniref:1,4-alpha-glucan branching enzyme GlgB n=1 Tax=Kytococcus aerolatus TaxID=592308 RepID=A0A212U0W1_9MICO|nr:1,4-alpha-glucan branching protein GlgB [Kytococcus aerolatus]SNC71761.1 1,4-alpha-glucan branching enzyme [Kytococcus aerolatus]
MSPSTLKHLLTEWMPRQRWFVGRTHEPRLQRIGTVRMGDVVDPEGTSVALSTLFVADRASSPATIYQVPLTIRTAKLKGAKKALLGEIRLAALGLSEDPEATGLVYDGAHDPAYAASIMAMSDRETSYGQGVCTMTGTPLKRRRAYKPPYVVTGARVLTGEQSNTTIAVTTMGGGLKRQRRESATVKIFRVLQPGKNPDIELQMQLAQHGSDYIPTPIGAIDGTWPDTEGEGQVTGQLAFANEYLGDVDDAWRVALAACREGRGFRKRARRLGEVTASVHQDLAAALGTVEPDEEHRAELLRRLHDRLDRAVAQAPRLAPLQAEARARIDALADLPWPALQRIHGDLHLGQVMDVPNRGWVVIDFEGEPLRPVQERRAYDLPLRDLAGMLRSFDYVAGTVAAADPAEAERVTTWARRVRAAFLEGYTAVAGEDSLAPQALLDALEVDKACYEVAYESQNRTEWVGIPVAGLERLLDIPLDPEETPAPGGEAQGGATRMHLALTHSDPAHITREEAHRLSRGRAHDPHATLGMHPVSDGVVVRALRPDARRVVAVLSDGSRHELPHRAEGVFGAHLRGVDPCDYRLEVSWPTADGSLGEPITQDDPYRHLPTVGEMDLHLFAEGRHEQLWTFLGAHVRTAPGPMGDSTGVAFTVWAPNARGVQVVGDFNHWDGRAHAMRSLGSSGVWELFVPGIGAGERYKFRITTAEGQVLTKADPMARRTEVPPATASIVDDSSAAAFAWTDDRWMRDRAETDPQTRPMSTYEVHLGSWRQGLDYRELADELVDYVQEMGFTHVELMPVAEHPYGPSWGYQVTGYYAPSSRFGTPDEFRHLVDRLHAAGIGVIVDWVPGHFPKDEWALARFDGQPLYEHPDPRRGDQPDWGTHVFDFGRHEVRNFLVANALYWLEEFHLDGLRVDAVASMLYLDYSREEGQWAPNQYGGRENLEAVQLLQETNATAHRLHPGIVTIAEESTAWPGVTAPTHEGGLGFSMKWNMGWMHDSLQYVQKDPVHRQHHHHELTFSMVYAYSERYVLPISHDEVVHGKGSLVAKMPGDTWQKYAGVRAYLAFMWSHPGKQLLFMGNELGVPREWSDGSGLDFDISGDPLRHGVQQVVRDLNARYTELPALWQVDHQPNGFRWIDADNAAGNVISFLRFAEAPHSAGGTVAVVVNFSGGPHEEFRVGLPHAGRWDEVLNTDATEYGGSGVGNLGSVVAEEVPWDGLPASAVVRVPPLGAVWFTPAQEG